MRRQPGSGLYHLDQHVTHLSGYVTGARFAKSGRIRGSLGLQLLDGDSNPLGHRREVMLRPKGAANDRAEAWNHRATKPRHRDGVSPSDRPTEITKFLVFSMHVGRPSVCGKRELGNAELFAVRPGPGSQAADCDTQHEPYE